jgi:hypothetical protein
MLWIFLFINTLLVFGAISSDQVQIGGDMGSVHKNAPFVIEQYYALMSLICLLMTTAFMTAAANRDYSSGMYQFVFTSPIRKYEYFFGKFIGAFTIAIIPLLGVSLGALIGPMMPWVQPERYGDVIWSSHLHGLAIFAIPNTLIIGVIVYGMALISRNNVVPFVGSMVILLLYVISQGYTRDIEKEWLANLLDPFGSQPLSLASKYMTVDEKNTRAVPLTGNILMNRAIWIGIGFLALLALYSRFSFSAPRERGKKKKIDLKQEDPVLTHAELRSFEPQLGARYSGRTLWHMIRFETLSVFKNQTFIIIVLIGLLNMIGSMSSFTGRYGSTYYPVTYSVIDLVRGAFYLFVVGIIIFYSGVLVWKERDAKISEITDVSPAPTGFMFISKLVAVIASIFFVMLSTIVVGIIVQAINGYTRFELSQYVISLLVIDLLSFAYLLVMALLFHYLINNRYIAYFAIVAFLILNAFIWNVLKINTNMLNFGSGPSITYSDMNGFGPFVKGTTWFYLYWMLFSVITAFIVFAFYVRGKDTAFKIRARAALHRLKKNKLAFATALIAFVAVAGYVYYNTQVLNTYLNEDESEAQQKAYELNYKKYQDLPSPKYTDLSYKIDIHPYERNLYVEISGTIVNKTEKPIPAFHFTIPQDMDKFDIEIPAAKLTLDNEKLHYRIYQLSHPMAPGDSMVIKIKTRKETKGFENQVSFKSLTHNGTFFNNADILPLFGYQRGNELQDKNKRKKMGLPARQKLAPLDDNNMSARANPYVDMNADFVNVRTVISTSGDQIAVAPGSLKREWKKDGRNFFEYQLDHPSLNFYSFISARYQVTRDKFNGIDIEVYHIKEHKYNVPNMVASMKKSLDYYTRNFGPYYHKQCRIIEFPRYASFAQAFPGTMPYSEGIGFITDLRDVKEDDIDMVYFIVAHEMGHQYWAHQLIGPPMRGSEMMSESFAEYSALMVMEKEYGRDKMRKFLSYEMDGYLRGRSRELEAERPLMQTENQGYIHYQKGSVVLYYLKEMIGEHNVNQALRQLINEHAYKAAPYPTANAAVNAFKAVTPDSLQYLIDDLFRNITLFSNSVVKTDFKKVGNEYEVSVITRSEKFRADSLGKEKTIALNDYIDVGVFGESKGKVVLGKPLAMNRFKITKADNTFTFRVREKPVKAGIDPYHYLIDRQLEDNLRKISED